MAWIAAVQAFPRSRIVPSELESGAARSPLVCRRARFQPGQSLVVTATLQKMSKLRIDGLRQGVREFDDARGNIGELKEMIPRVAGVKLPIGNQSPALPQGLSQQLENRGLRDHASIPCSARS